MHLWCCFFSSSSSLSSSLLPTETCQGCPLSFFAALSVGLLPIKWLSTSLSTSLFFSYSSTFNLPLHFSHHVSLSEFYKDLKWDISRFQLTPVPDKNLCWQSQRKGDGAIFSKRKSSDSKQKWWCDQFQKISRFAAVGWSEEEKRRQSGWSDLDDQIIGGGTIYMILMIRWLDGRRRNLHDENLTTPSLFWGLRFGNLIT